jgi:hypothetical protein
LSFTAHSINNTFAVSNSKRYDRSTALTALITAFRAEVTQNSISPEKVGSILQQIADLLAGLVNIVKKTALPDIWNLDFVYIRRVN